MKCRYCKAEIPEGELYCKKCGREVQIVQVTIHLRNVNGSDPIRWQ